jgi:hypothetical protein
MAEENPAPMSEEAWLVQIYQMTDGTTQSSAARLLSDFRKFSVDARTCERGSFLIVESEAASALSVHETVMMVDPDADLIHSAAGHSTQPA